METHRIPNMHFRLSTVRGEQIEGAAVEEVNSSLKLVFFY
jgi:hypothetical protein